LKAFAYLYWLIALLHLAGVVTGEALLGFFTKPLLMPVLIVWYYLTIRARQAPVHWLMMLAFAFSCAGDVFLMFTTELFFLLGLVSFLITHVLYSVSFNMGSRVAGVTSVLRAKPYVAFPVVALSAALITLLFPRIQPDMRIPVIVYTTVITVMVMMAVNRYGKVSATGFWLVTTGAVLFMLSDSLIALNKFYFDRQLPMAGFFIMLLYITAQYLIARGVSKIN